MRDRTFERMGALSGLAFFILAVLSGFIYPQQPRVDSARSKRSTGFVIITPPSRPA